MKPDKRKDLCSAEEIAAATGSYFDQFGVEFLSFVPKLTPEQEAAAKEKGRKKKELQTRLKAYNVANVATLDELKPIVADILLAVKGE